MVKLSLNATRGNANSRFFPHSGYLALTPVRVDGVIRTKLDDDAKPLLASSITVSVRCIESRIGRLGVAHSNVLVEYPQTLWSKPPSADWAEVGDSEHHFKITIPVKTPGFSSANFQDYRVFWRVEAVINHTPIFGVGSRQVKSFEIPLVRYDTAVPRRGLVMQNGFLKTNKPRAPLVRYHLANPTSPVGPLDIVSIPVALQPVDPSVSIRGASVVVERRIDLLESTPSPPPPTDPLSLHDLNDSESTIGPRTPKASISSSSPPALSVNTTPAGTSTSTLASTFSSTTYSTSGERRPLLRPIVTDIPAKTITLTVAAVESSGPFTRDHQGVFTKTLSLQWPATKSHSHWAMGATMQTDLISVRFFLRVKVIVSSPSSGTETLELEEREIFLISTNESERKLALGRYNESCTRTKSKSPRHRREQLPSPPLSPADALASHPVTQSAYPLDSKASTRLAPSSTASSSTLRRPHTSAGPRDRSTNRSHHRHHDPEPDHSGKGMNPFFRMRPGTANPLPLSDTNPNLNGRGMVTEQVAHNFSTSIVSDPGTVRAWEEELERIELQSRRSTADMLGFKRKRTTSRPGTGTQYGAVSGSGSP